MENRTRVIAAVVAVLISLAGVIHTTAATASPLRGAWKAIGIGSGENRVAVVGVAIFTDTYYSIMYFQAAPERPDITDVSKATADEMRALWGGWVANTGTYEINADLVTIHPTGAKNPVVMKPGANEVYRFRVDGNTLSWTQQRNARGVTVTNAATTTFVRAE